MRRLGSVEVFNPFRQIEVDDKKFDPVHARNSSGNGKFAVGLA